MFLKNPDGWKWFMRDLTDPEILENLDRDRLNPVKKNPVRVVFKSKGRSGKNYFVKIEKKTDLLSRSRNILFPKARSEFNSALLIEKAGIPCAKYVAWGVRGAESCVISEALEGFIPAPEYFFTRLTENNEYAEAFLKSIAFFASLFYKSGLVHPDFHPGNIMIHPENGKIAVIDPYGVCRKNYTQPDLVGLVSSCLFMKIIFPDQTIVSCLASAFGFPEEKTHFLFHEAEKRNAQLIQHEWPRRQKQILSGNSKFCRTEGNRIIRSSPWYTPVEWDTSHMETLVLPEEEAMSLWLDAFRAFLLCGKFEKTPVVLEHLPGRNVKLYFATEKDLPKKRTSLLKNPGNRVNFPSYFHETESKEFLS